MGSRPKYGESIAVIMKKASQVAVSFLLPGLLLLAGCRGTVGELSENTDVTFSIFEADSRTTVTSGEGSVGNWVLLLYRDGKLVDVGMSGTKAPIQRTLKTGPTRPMLLPIRRLPSSLKHIQPLQCFPEPNPIFATIILLNL
jgi:hypothetical protein